MYLSASRHFDTVIVWEQRAPNGSHKIRKYAAPYNCYVGVDDYNNTVRKFKQSVHEGEPDTVLKEFLGAIREAIDRTQTHTSMYGDELYRVEFPSGKQWKLFLSKVPTDFVLWESDIPPELKVLSANYYKAQDPIIRTTFYDLELDYDPNKPFNGAMDPIAPINSIAFYHVWCDKYVVMSIPPKSWAGQDPNAVLNWQLFDDVTSDYTIRFFQTEAELLAAAVEEIQECDLLSGWNSAPFDDPYFAQRVQIVLGDEWFKMLSFPGGKAPYFREVEVMFRKQKHVQFDGRITIDYMELFKKFTVEDRDSWNLESVSQDHLGERFKKLDYEGTLHELYNNNFSKFVRYNLRDTEILKELDGKYKFIQTGNNLVHQSTCHYRNIVGTVRTAEMAICNFCWHELGVRVPDTKVLDEQGQAAGAYVLVPQKGIKEWIICVDINSLYPNTERTLNLSPETIVGQFVEFGRAWEEIFNNTTTPLTLKWEKTGHTDTLLASEWRKKLWDLKFCISGYGTVFDQNREGIIPQLLGKWYADRKAFQAQAKKAAARKADLEKELAILLAE